MEGERILKSEKYKEVVSKLPKYLKAFAVPQFYEDYTYENQATWRFIMKCLNKHLKKYAHPTYLEGFDNTGLKIDSIPDIDEMNEKLEALGWGAIIVDGFIPPAIFMEFQANKLLPISAEMRITKHMLYTPAPDIVHEAAGHAPIINDPPYASFLQKVGEYGAKAISSKADYKVYEAVRHLSIVKEHPESTSEIIEEAEKNLQDAIKNNKTTSEASLISRFHWWTVEYGLIGPVDNPQIYGAGLLSSLEESHTCLEDDVKKIPLDLDCLKYSYDITKKQPQLFVAKDWEHLNNVLEQLADTMSFRIGGLHGIKKAIESDNLATVELSSGLQISGQISDVLTDDSDREIYLKTSGPTFLSYDHKVLPGHHDEYHMEGFGTPIGKMKDSQKLLEDFTSNDFSQEGLIVGQEGTLVFESGVTVKGKLENILEKNNKIVLLTFTNCKVTGPKGEILFDPSWGTFDMGVGERATSVYNGHADKEFFDFIPPAAEKTHIPISDEKKKLDKYYKSVMEMRQKGDYQYSQLVDTYEDAIKNYPKNWLLRMEVLELLAKFSVDEAKDLKEKILIDFKELRKDSYETNFLIPLGLEVFKSDS